MKLCAQGTSWNPAACALALGLGHPHVARPVKDAWGPVRTAKFT